MLTGAVSCSSETFEQLGQRNVERERDCLDIPQRDVPLAALDPGSYRWSRPAPGCEFLLRFAS